MEGVVVGVNVGVGGCVGVFELLLLLLLDGCARGQTHILSDDDVALHAHLTHGRGGGRVRGRGGDTGQDGEVEAPVDDDDDDDNDDEKKCVINYFFYR